MSKAYDTDGNPWEKYGHIPPLVHLEHNEESYVAGWYHCNEIEQLIGPFSSRKEAADAYIEYVKGVL